MMDNSGREIIKARKCVHVAGFALYEGVRQFGATAHIMTSQVDEGNIIGTEIFDIPQYCEFEMLEIMTYQAITLSGIIK